MLLAKYIIPPKEWYHDPELTDNNGHTVSYYLKENNIKVPEEWKTEFEKINL